MDPDIIIGLDLIITIRIKFSPIKERPNSTSWVGGVESNINTGPLFKIVDNINNIVFVVVTVSTISLLPEPDNLDSEAYTGP